MQLLQSIAGGRALLSPIESLTYLTNDCNTSANLDVVTDKITMDFLHPTSGNLTIRGVFKNGEAHFVIQFSSSFQSSNGDGSSGTIDSRFTLVGDAHTGVITQMLLESDSEKPNTTLPEISWAEIQQTLKATGDARVWQLQKQGFKAFSRGEVTIPAVIYMPFSGRGDLHLKGAHKKQGDIYVFKIATGFPGNIDKGLQSSQGMMIAFDARTGRPLMVLNDEGHLTDLRTAIAGRNAAQEMMPAKELAAIGMVGTGVQARLHLGLLKELYPACRKLTVCGHTPANTQIFANEMRENGWEVDLVDTPGQMAKHANLIITTTPSQIALLDAADIIFDNTLIIAIGADMPGKVELSPALLKKADTILIDSIAQGCDHGNAAIALKNEVIVESDLQEFGDFLATGYRDATADKKLRLFLSSGIGVQDLQIVQAVLEGSEIQR